MVMISHTGPGLWGDDQPGVANVAPSVPRRSRDPRYSDWGKGHFKGDFEGTCWTSKDGYKGDFYKGADCWSKDGTWGGKDCPWTGMKSSWSKGGDHYDHSWKGGCSDNWTKGKYYWKGHSGCSGEDAGGKNGGKGGYWINTGNMIPAEYTNTGYWMSTGAGNTHTFSPKVLCESHLVRNFFPCVSWLASRTYLLQYLRSGSHVTVSCYVSVQRDV